MADVSFVVAGHDEVSTTRVPSPTLAKGLIVPLVILAAWAVVAYLNPTGSKLLVSPLTVLASAVSDDVGQGVWASTLISLVRMSVGFAIGGAIGLATGILTGTVALADKSLSPTLNALRQIALFAWMPLLTGWFGNGETTRLIYIALSAYFPIAFSVHEGIKQIPASHLEVAAVLRLGRKRRLKTVVLPAAAPSLCTGLQIGLLTAWLGTISAEYVIGVSNGLGSLIVYGREQFRMEIVLLGVLALSIVGYAIVAISATARRYILRNHGVVR